MPSFKIHCRECQDELGKDYGHVHRWLDEYAAKYWPWMGHRIFRHHVEGIEKVREQWGDEAAYAAELHILSDCRQVGVYDGVIPSKKDVEKLYDVRENFMNDEFDEFDEPDEPDEPDEFDEIAERNWRERYGEGWN